MCGISVTGHADWILQLRQGSSRQTWTWPYGQMEGRDIEGMGVRKNGETLLVSAGQLKSKAIRQA